MVPLDVNLNVDDIARRLKFAGVEILIHSALYQEKACDAAERLPGLVTGRASRTIVLSSGKKIAPEELEDKLHSFPGVLEALVSGEGETRDVKAEIYASIPEERVREAVSALNRTLPVYQRIKTIVVRTEPFPRTSSGKIKLG